MEEHHITQDVEEAAQEIDDLVTTALHALPGSTWLSRANSIPLLGYASRGVQLLITAFLIRVPGVQDQLSPAVIRKLDSQVEKAGEKLAYDVYRGVVRTGTRAFIAAAKLIDAREIEGA